MFWFGFLGLTVVYGLIGVGIIFLIARVRGTEPRVYLEDEDTYFWILLGAMFMTCMIALYNWGPALLLPENTPNMETRSTANGIIHNILFGRDSLRQDAVTEPLPWARGTWFWHKAALTYVLLTAMYGVSAFKDEVSNGLIGLADFIKARRRRARVGGRHEEGHEEGDIPPSHFWQPDFWDIVSIIEMLSRVLSKRHTR